MRTRTKDLTEDQLVNTYWRPRETCADDSFDITYGGVGVSTSMTDNVTPNFRQRVAQGEVIVNYMTQTTTERHAITGTKGHFHDVYVFSPYSCTMEVIEYDGGGIIKPFPLPNRQVQHREVVFDKASLHIEAATQARSLVAEPTFAGATFVAELSDAVQLFRSPLRAMKDLLHDIKTDQRKAARKYRGLPLASFISKHWLWYRYGIMPIVYDMRDASEALTTLEGWGPPRITVRGKSKDQGTASEIEHGTNVTAWSVEREVETSAEYSVRTGIIYEYSGENTFGVSLADVPNALWELVPFSFVVDWFGNVNNYIAAITPKVGVKVLGEWTVATHTQETTGTGYSTGRLYNETWNTYVSDPTSDEFVKTTSKTRWPRLAKSGVVFRIPDFVGEVIGRKRVLDAFSLVLGMLGRS